MGFLSPLFLAGAMAAAIPIALHLLRRDPDVRVRFAAVDLLRSTAVEDTERRRLRHWLLLALRVGALVVLAVAFARPFLTAADGSGADGVTVVALDTSLSMSAPDYFARAQQVARDIVDEAPRGHLVGVVTFADRAVPAAEPSVDRAAATRAIDAARAGPGATRYRTALEAAGGLLANRPGRIVVVTDRQASGWDPDDRVALPADAAVEVRDIGPAPPNLAVTDVREVGERIVATIRNWSPVEREVKARLGVDGAEVAETTGRVAPGGATDVTFSAATGALRVAIDDPDGLAADNARFAVIDAAAGLRLLVLTSSGDLERDAYYVKHALEAGRSTSGQLSMTGMDGSRFSALEEASLHGYGALLLLSTKGLDQRGRELVATFARQGGGVLVAAGPDVDGDVAADALGRAVSFANVAAAPGAPVRRLAPVDLRHPVLRAFAPTAATLALTRFTRVQSMEPGDCATVARFSAGEPALVDCRPASGRVLAFASDLNGRWNDFPLRAAFVPFLHEAVRYLVSDRAQVSSFLVGAVPEGVAAEPGVVTLPGAGAGGPRVAVNVDPRESDPARAAPDAFESAVARIATEASEERPRAAVAQEERQRLWRYGMLLVAALLVAESLVSARTI